MGKYSKYLGKTLDRGSLYLYKLNELAEANRLKRLELCFHQVTSKLDQQTLDDIFDHDRELYDLA